MEHCALLSHLEQLRLPGHWPLVDDSQTRSASATSRRTWVRLFEFRPLDFRADRIIDLDQRQRWLAVHFGFRVNGCALVVGNLGWLSGDCSKPAGNSHLLDGSLLRIGAERGCVPRGSAIDGLGPTLRCHQLCHLDLGEFVDQSLDI